MDAAIDIEDRATCRNCSRVLIGRNYCYGGRAGIPGADGRYLREAPTNYYGGFVCSRSCDYRACLDLERSMPGHSWSQQSIDGRALAAVNSNWPEAS